MRRRKFLTLVGGTAIMCPLEAHTQQAGKLPRIGFLGAAARVKSRPICLPNR
jgi:hypothetical protein